MDIQDIRRANLSKTIDELKKTRNYKNLTAIVEQHPPASASHISQILNKHVGFGEKAARKIESQLNLIEGSLDTPIDINETACLKPKLKIYDERQRDIPVLDINKSIHWKEIISNQDLFEETMVSEYQGLIPSDIFCLDVIEENMEPLFLVKDRITVDPNRKPENLDFVLMQYGKSNLYGLGQYQVESYNSDGSENFNINSTNKNFPSFSSKINNLSILAVVVKLDRKLK